MGVSPLHPSLVQGLLSSGGASAASATSTTLPAASHAFFLQLPVIGSAGGSVISGTVTTLLAPSQTFLRQSPGSLLSTSVPASRLVDAHAPVVQAYLRHSVLIPHSTAEVQLHLPPTHLRLPPSPHGVPSARGVFWASPSMQV